MKLIIDGYNLMFCGGFKDRDDLIGQLAHYRSRAKHISSFLVVFDGTHQGTLNGDRDVFKGIEIVFTPIHEIADDWIEDYLQSHKHESSSFLVVSSDRKVQKAAMAVSSDWINSEHFGKRLEQNGSSFSELLEQEEWHEGRENVDELYQESPKKGNPRKLSKKERQKRKKLNKL